MRSLTILPALAAVALAIPYNSFEGYPVCNEVAAVYHPTSVGEIVSLVQNATAAGHPIRASGVGHMWYDTMCSDDPNTVIIMTNGTAGIGNFTFDPQSNTGTVDVEAGVTFFELADFLHAHGASIGYSLVNWNITLAGAISMCAHRTSLAEDATVSAAVLALDIVVANGTVVQLSQAEHGGTDTWYAAICNLGLLGVVARATLKVRGEFKISANQQVLDEDDVLNGDIAALISPYPTANFWWWPSIKKFHHRTYTVVPDNNTQEGFQSTFSITALEAGAAKTLLQGGVDLNSSVILETAEATFFAVWSAPNFHDKSSNLPILTWPVTGYSQDNLIGGLYPGEEPEWDYNLHGYTMEIAFPVTQANAMFKRVRELLDASAAAGAPMTATYRSGVNIKFAKAFDSLVGQSTTLGSSAASAAYKDGAIMLDWPSYRPDAGIRYNEPFYLNLSTTLLNEFPFARPHWTKNTRQVMMQAKANLDPELLSRFATVRKSFDPNGTFKSIVGEILGLM